MKGENYLAIKMVHPIPMPTDFFGYTTSIPIPRSILDLEKPSSVHAYHGGFGTCDEYCCLAFIFLQQYQLR
jgi:hypothetical protein